MEPLRLLRPLPSDGDDALETIAYHQIIGQHSANHE